MEPIEINSVSTESRRLELIREVHAEVAQRVLLHEGVGGDLSNVLGAIAKGERHPLPETNILVDVLRRVFPTNHSVWQYVIVKTYPNEHYGM